MHPGAVRTGTKPMDLHPMLRQQPGLAGAGSEMHQGRLRDGSCSGCFPQLLLEQCLWLVGLQNLSLVKPDANNLCSWARLSDL